MMSLVGSNGGSGDCNCKGCLRKKSCGKCPTCVVKTLSNVKNLRCNLMLCLSTGKFNESIDRKAVRRAPIIKKEAKKPVVSCTITDNETHNSDKDDAKSNGVKIVVEKKKKRRKSNYCWTRTKSRGKPRVKYAPPTPTLSKKRNGVESSPMASTASLFPFSSPRVFKIPNNNGGEMDFNTTERFLDAVELVVEQQDDEEEEEKVKEKKKKKKGVNLTKTVSILCSSSSESEEEEEEGERQCESLKCRQGARRGSKYCSIACGMRLARDRINYITILRNNNSLNILPPH